MAGKALTLTTANDQPDLYRERELWDGRYYPCINPAYSDTARASLMDQSAIGAAASHMKNWSGQEFGCVYVIGLRNIDRCKIGFSVNPLKRIGHIQIGLWDKVICYSLFWSLKDGAQELEYNAHQKAKREGVLLRGEWVALDGVEATKLVLGSPPAKYTDSKNFLDVWLPISFSPVERREPEGVVSPRDYDDWSHSKLA